MGDSNRKNMLAKCSILLQKWLSKELAAKNNSSKEKAPQTFGCKEKHPKKLAVKNYNSTKKYRLQKIIAAKIESSSKKISAAEKRNCRHDTDIINGSLSENVCSLVKALN